MANSKGISPHIKTGLILVMIWAIVKMVLFMTRESELGFNTGVFLNFLFIILAVIIVLFRKYKLNAKGEKVNENIDDGVDIDPNEGRYDTLSDLIDASKGALTYVLFMIIFMFVYYTFIDKNYLHNRAEDRIAIMHDYVYEGDNWTEMKKLDEHVTQETQEEYMEFQSKNIHEQYSKNFIVGFGFAVWMLVSIVCTIVITLLFRFVLLK